MCTTFQQEQYWELQLWLDLQNGLAGVVLGAGASLSHVSAARAAEVVAEVAEGVSPFEILAVSSPILLYGVFRLYADKVNPQAKVIGLGATQPSAPFVAAITLLFAEACLEHFFCNKK
jgi:hypothetical protein